MPTAPTPKDHSTARVIRDTLEMESFVTVTCIYLEFQKISTEPTVSISAKLTNMAETVNCLCLKYIQCSIRYDEHFSIYFPLSDIDECFPEQISHDYHHLAHNCHADANCSNTKGSFHCMCHTGYSGDGVSCIGKINL